MNLLSIETISKQYAERPLFQEVTFGMNRGERIGVIGVNGSGKSTLLRIIAGIELPDTGRVVFAGGTHVAYLPQAPLLPEQQTVLEAVFAGDSPTIRLLRRYEQVSAQLAEQPHNHDLLAQLNALTPQMDALGAWDAEAAAHTIITELGLAEYVNAPIAILSGGQRKRVAMARALVDQPDLLILDEPTNHIDTDTIAWMEDYLARIPCALILVTHDRYFLDRLVTRMLELDRGRLTSYNGNYASFLEQKAERLVQEAAAEESRQNLLRREIAWLRRGAQARTTKQKAHVERVHSLMAQRPDAAQGTVEIDLGTGRRIGKRILELHAVSKRYGERSLINAFSLELRANDRIGIIGPNGSGKSTLLNLIAGRVEPDSGEIRVGTTIHMAYYDQESAGLDLSMRVVDYIREVAELVRGRDGALVAATQMLERFLFTAEMQWTTIERLSGGERRRLYLLRQLIHNPNLLILDEPTNDLDLQTLGVLEDYLDEFNGVVITVSHDRYFLDRVVGRIFAFEGAGRIVEYPGNYSLYREYRARQASTPPPTPAKPRSAPTPPPPSGPRKLNSKERREIESLERRISELEAQRDLLGEQLNQTGNDHTRYAQIADQLAQIEAAIETAFTRWAELSELA
ncbi:ABC-F family ATP-binding cassette domain-containing protein [Candidatus Oscillochloris fontis]|uniref:ABC-F family ATP-binding cassette domain-containing protein n=1 Tax=Candidatus Oscillochloris fontis TaxID=2496868 RepID=UPI00101BF5E7|nr:ABC-F family ATP-binding cassette domain-containing protein [Candidatus Oscillochloris fontis]